MAPALTPSSLLNWCRSHCAERSVIPAPLKQQMCTLTSVSVGFLFVLFLMDTAVWLFKAWFRVYRVNLISCTVNMDSTRLITWLTVHLKKTTKKKPVLIYFILDPQFNILSTSSSSFGDSPSSFWTAGRLFKNLCVSTYAPPNSTSEFGSDVTLACPRKIQETEFVWFLVRWSHSGLTAVHVTS